MSKIRHGIVSAILAGIIAGSSALADSPASSKIKQTDEAPAINEYNFQHLWTLILSRMGTNGPNSQTDVGPLPYLARTPIPSMNAPLDEAEIIGLWNANRDTLDMLKKDPKGREKLEALMEREP